MTKLHELFSKMGQSPWLDNIRRDYITGGKLEILVEQGVRGLTSNPTIFANAIESEDDYDEQLQDLASTYDTEECYWRLVADDIRGALAILRPTYDASSGTDGFASLEVSPMLAHDTAGTLQAARKLHADISSPNLLIKVPATKEGAPAVRALISEGISVNVTLIFSLQRYEEVIEAYISGLEDRLRSGAERLDDVASVASFFVSRVDTEVDSRIRSLSASASDAAERGRLDRLAGAAAVAQAKLAYEIFSKSIDTPRWRALASRGARPQRPLWASTSTKNPAYSDLVYVDNLIAPDTVNTMPDATLASFLDHGTLERTADKGLDEARRSMQSLLEVGIDLDDVSALLERQGVEAFQNAFASALQCLEAKVSSLAPR